MISSTVSSRRLIISIWFIVDCGVNFEMNISVAEDKFLHQIHLEEKFGPVLKNSEESNPTKKKACAAIGYNYDEDDGTNNLSLVKIDDTIKNNFSSPSGDGNAEDENDSESDIDLGNDKSPNPC